MQINSKIGVIDFGGQYAHLITSRLRRLGVFSEILSNEEILEHYREFKGLIFSGGPASVYNEAAPTISQEIFELGIPILGICYGHQLIMKLLGGEVESAQFREYGDAEIYITDKTCPLVQDLKEVQKVWMSHGDEVSKLADGFLRFASSVSCKYAGVYHPEKKIYGIQFHPEVTHTPQGNKFLENFIEICGVTRNWDMKHFLDEKLKELRESIPEPKKVFMLVSGGVDSTVAYTLLSKALGKKRVVGLLVDTGFMREKEVKIVKKKFRTSRL
jgi:GMP synthase (glutamine-hydrolysing)